MTDKHQEARDALTRGGSVRKAAKMLGIPPSTLQHRLAAAPKPFEVAAELPSLLPSVDDLLARRREEFARIDAAKAARKLIDVAVRIDGPIGIAHGGDPHLDNPGTNIALVERHVDLVNRTEGLFGANVGDLHDNWVGRLARLYGESSTSAQEAWLLTEWYCRSMHFLYLIGGNHDCWSGAGDPVKWIMRQGTRGVHENHGARLNLCFPNGRHVRVNARHDFKGFSQWNTAHGPSKAAQMGWRDHVLIAGHLHISGYNILKDPSNGLISHAIRVASYKTHDRYGEELGLPDQNISECVVTVIDPDARLERQLVTVFMDPEEGADFLTWKRGRRSAATVVSQRDTAR